MLKNAKTILGFKIEAIDGDIGHVSDLFFDDEHWVIRYIVVKTGGWLNRKEVLLSPIGVASFDWSGQGIRVRHTIEEVQNSPDVDTHMPLSRQKELEFHEYYGWSPYWGLPTIWAAGGFPTVYPWQPNDRDRSMEQSHRIEGDQHLRSMKEIEGYHIQANDASFGHVEGFIFETESWSIRYLVIDTVNYWPSKSILVSPAWITKVSWSDRKVFIDMQEQELKSKPDYHEDDHLKKVL